MSGWIKLEKELREDVRVRRMAKTLSERDDVTHVRYRFQKAVTQVLGGLAQLWMHADSFARDDDSLDLSTQEIDELVGIEGFAKLLPQDWLQEVDAGTVKLPGFHTHSGSEAKRKALTAKRVSKLRNARALQQEKSCNAPALPDQTRLDHKKTRSARARAAPPVVHDPELETHVPDAPTSPPPPEGLDLAAWHRWTAYRAQIRKPLKPPSVPAAQKALAAYGPDQAAVVEQSIANGWQGLFAPKAAAHPHRQDTPDANSHLPLVRL